MPIGKIAHALARKMPGLRRVIFQRDMLIQAIEKMQGEVSRTEGENSGLKAELAEARAAIGSLTPKVSPPAVPTPPVPELVMLGGTMRGAPTATDRPPEIKRILVLKLDGVGDFVLGMGEMQMLRGVFPGAHITMVCAAFNVDWARQLNIFDRVVAFDYPPSMVAFHTQYTLESLKQLQDDAATAVPETYDLAIDMRYYDDTRPCLYRMRATYRAGFAAPIEPGLPYLDLIAPPCPAAPGAALQSRSLHAEHRSQMLIALVVAAFGARTSHPMRRCTHPEDGIGRRYAVLSIGAGTPVRLWPIERFAEVARALIEQHDFDIAILAGKVYAANAEDLAALLPAERVRMVVDRPIAEIPQFMAGASLCVSNDTGMSHLAAALDIPTVTIMAGHDGMEIWRPSGVNAIGLGGWTPCQPCGLRLAEECPWGVACVHAITPDHVLTACKQMLERARASVTS